MVQHHAHRRARFHAGQAAGRERIVRQHGADADQDGVTLRAQQMHPRPAASPVMATGSSPAAAIFSSAGCRELEDHMWAFVPDAPEMSSMVVGRLDGTRPDIDRYTGGPEPGMAPPGYLRIGILDRRHHAGDAGGEDGVNARRGFARNANRARASHRGLRLGGLLASSQRLLLGMGAAAGLGPAAADDHAILDHDAADGGIGRGAAPAAPAERQREAHKMLVGGLTLPLSISARTGLPECGRSFA